MFPYNVMTVVFIIGHSGFTFVFVSRGFYLRLGVFTSIPGNLMSSVVGIYHYMVIVRKTGSSSRAIK
jgi:hypothetical protein